MASMNSLYRPLFGLTDMEGSSDISLPDKQWRYQLELEIVDGWNVILHDTIGRLSRRAK